MATHIHTIKLKPLLTTTSLLFCMGLCLQLPLLICYAPHPLVWLNLLAHLLIALLAVLFSLNKQIPMARTCLLFGYYSYLVFATLLWSQDVYIQHFLLVGCLCCAYFFHSFEQRERMLWALLYAVSFCTLDLYLSHALEGWLLAVRRGNSITLTLTCVAVSIATYRHNAKQWWQLKTQYQHAKSLLIQSTPAIQVLFHSPTGDQNRQHFNFCCVLFADVKGYQQLVARHGELKVIDTLDRFYAALDSVSPTYDVFPLKTNGDEYMAICGIAGKVNETDELNTAATRQSQHIANMQNFAVYAQKRFQVICHQQQWPCYLRLGIATGAVTAGMPNRQHGTFDVWGKTVNLAAMLEQASEGNTVLLCPSSYSLLPRHLKPCFEHTQVASKIGVLNAYRRFIPQA